MNDPHATPATDASVGRAIGANAEADVPAINIACALVEFVVRLGARLACGVGGGPILPIWEALCAHPVLRCVLHPIEAAAAYAAVEGSLASNRIVACFATTGPGVVGMMPGLAAARPEGARILLFSALTPPVQRGSGDVQATDQFRPLHLLGADGSIFHLTLTLDHAADLPALLARVTCEFASRPNGCVIHIAVSPHVMRAPVPNDIPDPRLVSVAPPAPSRATAALVADRLVRFRTVAWVGFGARLHQRAVLDLLERTGMPAMVTPRGMGIVPAGHPQLIGMPGMVDTGAVARRLDELEIEQTLVLGSTLGQPSRGDGDGLSRSQGFIFVDIAPVAASASFHGARKLIVHADIGLFLEELERVEHPRLRTVR